MLLTTFAEINPEYMVDRLNCDEAMELIKLIDQGQCDVDFTFEMAKWFIKDVLVYDDDGKYAQEFKEIIEGTEQ